MRILVLTADFPPAQWSGIGTAVFHQVNAFREIGADVEVLTRERLNGARFPIAVRDDDVVHLHSLSLASLALELTQRFGTPLVYTAHSILERELGSDAPEWVELQRRVFERADRVIFVSRAERDAAIERMPSIADRAHVMHNGVPAPPAVGTYDAEGPIVFAGRFTRTKGFDLVLDMIGSLPRPFVLAGGHGDRDLHDRARALAAGNSRCRLAGWLPSREMHALLARAAIVVMPSRYEPFGMVALEAMRAGAPLLASGAGGLSEIVTPESGGRIVAEMTPHAWIDAISRLLSDVDARGELHARGPRYVAAHFSARTLAEAALALLHTTSACRRCST